MFKQKGLMWTPEYSEGFKIPTFSKVWDPVWIWAIIIFSRLLAYVLRLIHIIFIQVYSQSQNI